MPPQSALITGASRGIGFAIAHQFLRRGCPTLALLASNAERLVLAKEALQRTFPQARIDIIACDLRNLSSSASTSTSPPPPTSSISTEKKSPIAHLRSIWSHPPSTIVHAAGISRSSLLATHRAEDIRDMMEVNLVSPMLLNRELIRWMLGSKSRTTERSHQHRSIVHIGSVAAFHGSGGQSAYSATKAGLVGLSKSLAKELGGRAITVNVVSPGFVETDMTDREVTEQTRRTEILSRLAIPRFASAEEIAECTYFVSQAPYITGQVVTIDGGLSL